MINDSDIIHFIENHGPATLGQINRYFVSRNASTPKNRIYHDVGLKARSLVKFRILKTIHADGAEYYALPEMDGPIEPDTGNRAEHRIRAYIDDLPDGATLTYASIKRHVGVSKDTARASLKNIGVRRVRDKPAVYLKGAS